MARRRYDAHFYEGAEGRRWVYASDVTLRCPYAEGPPAWMDDDLEQAEFDAAALGDTPFGLDLAMVFRHAHEQRTRGGRFDTDDAPGRCRACGAHLERRGYRAWCEEPWPDEATVRREVERRAKVDGWSAERAARNVDAELMSRATGDGYRVAPGSPRYFPLKREAIAWCREQAQIDRAADDPVEAAS